MSIVYSLSQTIKITGVPQSRLQTWLREEYIVPCVKGKGSGSRNGYDFRNLCQIKFFDYLVKNGVAREAAADHLGRLPSSAELKNDQQKTNFIIAGRDLKSQETEVKTLSSASNGNYTELKLTINHDPDKLPHEWKDIITIYCLKRIVFEVTKGIESLE